MLALVCHDPNTPPTTPASPGFEWKYVTKPDVWEKEEDQDCWCGALWYANNKENHEDGDHGGVWIQVGVHYIPSKY